MLCSRAHELGGFFKPESIAVIGVSRKVGSFGGYSFLKRFRDTGYTGRLYPINAKASEIIGLAAYPSVASLPDTPDLAMIAVPAGAVPTALKDCAKKGIRYIHILTSGFSEIGTEEGKQLENQIAAIAAEHNLLIIGPNCMGPYCPSTHLTAWGAIPGLDGRLGVISHSGGMTQRFTEYISSLSVGISKAASIGNGTVLDIPDFLEFMAGDDSIGIIAMYLEGIRNGKRFFDLIQSVSPHKPIIMLKGGASTRGAATVESHTGRMAGNQDIWKAICAQTGVVTVINMNEWVDTCLAFSLLPKTKGKRVFIIGGGGGSGVIFSDSCIREGLDVPMLSRASMKRIRTFVPIAGNIAGNPLDFWTAFLVPEILFEVLDAAYKDQNIDMVIVDRLIPRKAFHSPDIPNSVAEIVRYIKTHRQTKPTVFTIDYDGGDPELISKGSQLRSCFCQAGVPAFPSFERAIGTLARFQKYCCRFG